MGLGQRERKLVTPRLPTGAHPGCWRGALEEPMGLSEPSLEGKVGIAVSKKPRAHHLGWEQGRPESPPPGGATAAGAGRTELDLLVEELSWLPWAYWGD